jgi:hypothetical protein
MSRRQVICAAIIAALIWSGSGPTLQTSLGEGPKQKTQAVNYGRPFEPPTASITTSATAITARGGILWVEPGESYMFPGIRTYADES